MGGFFHDVLEGRVRDVRKWGGGGQKVGLYDEYGNTALHMAAEKGFRGVCKVLLDAGADVNQRNESVGWTAVHYASYEGHADVLRMLIAHGARADIADKAGDTAEAYAREWDNEECLRVLEEALGKSRHLATRQSESKADSLCDSRDSRYRIFYVLLLNDSTFNGKNHDRYWDQPSEYRLTIYRFVVIV